MESFFEEKKDDLKIKIKNTFYNRKNRIYIKIVISIGIISYNISKTINDFILLIEDVNQEYTSENIPFLKKEFFLNQSENPLKIKNNFEKYLQIVVKNSFFCSQIINFLEIPSPNDQIYFEKFIEKYVSK